MKLMLFLLMACLTLAGCGLGETAVSAAAGASSQAEQAKEALKTEARVKEQLDAAAALAAQQRQAAEASSQ
jgi:Na+-transporting methylmalonyl-CoA/oxaloacetate decarboxylase gamma subunit